MNVKVREIGLENTDFSSGIVMIESNSCLTDEYITKLYMYILESFNFNKIIKSKNYSFKDKEGVTSKRKFKNILFIKRDTLGINKDFIMVTLDVDGNPNTTV